MATLQNITPAGSRIRAYLEGGPELDAALGRLVKGLRDELLAEAVQAGGTVIAQEWAERVPVAEGDYKAAVRSKSKPGKKGATALVGVDRSYDGGEGDHYRDINARAVVLEFGVSGRGRLTSGAGRHLTPARPSARPAFDAAQGRAVDAIETKLRQLVEAAVP